MLPKQNLESVDLPDGDACGTANLEDQVLVGGGIVIVLRLLAEGCLENMSC